MSTRRARPRVVIVGGGFAGLACANNLDARRFAVTLVDRKRHFEFLPNIHELLSGVKKPRELRLPLGQAMQAQGHDFICAEVSMVDAATRVVQLGRKKLQADYLLLANGSEDADFGVAGVREHSLPFKSVAHCEAIAERLAALSRRAQRSRVVIVGGGLEGIEALGEILRAYRDRKFTIVLLEARQRILPALQSNVSSLIREEASAWGVQFVLADPVARVTAKTVLLASGRRLRSDATIWTGGPTPPTLFAESELAAPRAWIAVDKTLQPMDYPGVFVAGDAAELPSPISRQAYHALDMGRCAAQNIARAASGRRLRAFRPSPKPTLLSFGDLTTVLITPGTAIAGPALAAGKETVFTTVMTQLDQRSPRQRLGALLERGRSAGRELLWPALSELRRLPQQAKVRVLSE